MRKRCHEASERQVIAATGRGRVNRQDLGLRDRGLREFARSGELPIFYFSVNTEVVALRSEPVQEVG